MADENLIINRVVVQGLDEATAQITSLRKLLSDTKNAFEQARRSDDQKGMFQGSVKSADELRRLVNDIQKQITELNREIASGDFGKQEKALNEELKIRKAISDQRAKDEQALQRQLQQMDQKSSKEIAQETARQQRITAWNTKAAADTQKMLDSKASEQQKLIDQMAAGRERSNARRTAEDKQWELNQANAINKNSRLELEAIQKKQQEQAKAIAQEAQLKEKERLKEAQEWERMKASFKPERATGTSQGMQDALSVFGKQASYAQQMSSLSSGIEEQFQLFRRGAIGANEYSKALEQYTKGMSLAETEQTAFKKSIGEYTTAWDHMRERVKSHASWIVAGGLIGAALMIPTKVFDDIKTMDTAMAGVNQVLDHTGLAAKAAAQGISEQQAQQKMLNEESQKFLTISAQYGESVENIVEAGKLWGKQICSAA